MGLSSTLSTALTGLNVNQQALSVLSQNIANANTAGYSRQIINQQSVSLDGQGQGVNITDITRKVDEYLTRAVRVQSSDVGTTAVIDDYNTRLQLMLGQPGSQNSIDSYVNNYFNAVQSLAQTPDNTTLQQGVVNNGVALAAQLHNTASGIQDLQFQSDQDILAAIKNVNTDLVNIKQLNISITSSASLGKSVADLQDQRDNLLKDVSSYININTFTREDGSINITSGTGLPLLDDNLYQLSYSAASSAATFGNSTTLGPITINQIDANGKPSGTQFTLVPGGIPSEIVSGVTGGKIAGLLTLRDQQLPALSSQLDSIASGLRDQVNAIHNAGTSFPGANSLTGTRLTNAQSFSEWSGSTRIAVLDQNGQPIPSPYPDENGKAPLTLDLSKLANGSPTTQNIIDAFNQYYGTPQNKAELGNLNNIQMVSQVPQLPANPPVFNFSFSLDNLSTTGSKFYITGAQVTDNLGGAVATATLNVPSVNLATNGTFTTTGDSTAVIVKTATPPTFRNGDVVYIPAPTSPSTIGGIPASALGGFFTVSNVTSNSFQITAPQNATITTSVDSSGIVMPPYANVAAGGSTQTAGNGLITANLSGNTTAPYYNVTATMWVDNGSGVPVSSQVTYRVNNNQANMQGLQFAGQNATGSGTIVSPLINHPLATATMVDANGKELPKVNGKYVTTQDGYLKIAAYDSTNVISIDSMDSKELGHPNGNPPTAGTNRGFSHYFDLNDFFVSNVTTPTGDTVANSAINMQVSKSLTGNPGLISLGQLTQQVQTAGGKYRYTYELTPSNNAIIQRLSGLTTQVVNFGAIGGLGATAQTFSGYAGQIVGAAASTAASAKSNSTNAQTILDGYSKQSASVSGVNLDNELANTVIYQNAYSASARVISVANSLFETLLNTFQ